MEESYPDWMAEMGAGMNEIPRKTYRSATLFLVLGMASLLPAFAQQPVKPDGGDTVHADAAASFNVRASQLLGLAVMSSERIRLGRVHDLIFDWSGERLRHVVIAGRRESAAAEEFTVYPSHRFHFGRWEDELLLDEGGEGMPAQSNGPAMPGHAPPLVARDDQSKAGEEQVAGLRVDSLPVAALLGAPIVDGEGKQIGELNDFVVSLPDGRIRYLAMDPAHAFHMPNRLLILPPPALQPQPAAASGPGTDRAQETAAVRLRLAPGLDERRLAMARTVNKRQWPKVNGAHIKAEMSSYLSTSSWPWQAGNAAAGNPGSGAADSGQPR